MAKAKVSAKPGTSATKPAPWWLGGDEECPHCGQVYVVEVEFRCPDCDGPSCPHCQMTHAEGHFVCPECLETKNDG